MRHLPAALLLIVTLGTFSLPAFWHSDPRERGVLRLYGEIDVRWARPAFNRAGRIALVEKDWGDRVRQGEPIARLEDAFDRAREAAARAHLASARARLSELEEQSATGD